MKNKELFNVSKRKLCELTSQYYNIPPVKDIVYKKLSRHFAYFLYFLNENNHEVKVYFDRHMNENILLIECKQENWENMYHPTDEKLLELGLIKKEKDCIVSGNYECRGVSPEKKTGKHPKCR